MPNLAEQSLIDQLNLTEHEIEHRKHLFDFTDEDAQRLMACHPYMAENVENLVTAFYDQQLRKAEVAAVINDADTLRSLHDTFKHYLLGLCGGDYGSEYVNRRLRIGKIHKRMDISPKLYMSSLRLLQELIDEEIDKWSGTVLSKEEANQAKLSFHKILLLDAQFVLDSYIDSFVLDVDSARREVEVYATKLEIKVDEQTRQLREISTKDHLTSLYNHRAFYDFFNREIEVAKRYKLPLSLVYFDLNGFKELNDREGHQMGDKVLENVGQVLIESVRSIDIPCRYGGDEFCLILPRTEINDAEMICNRVLKRFDDKTDHSVFISMGAMQTGPEEFIATETMIKRTDDLMYKAKGICRAQGGHHISCG